MREALASEIRNALRYVRANWLVAKVLASYIGLYTLYKLFGSKEAVFGALVEWRQDEFLLEVQTLASEDVAPPERLQRLIEGIFRYFEVHGYPGDH